MKHEPAVQLANQDLLFEKTLTVVSSLRSPGLEQGGRQILARAQFPEV